MSLTLWNVFHSADVLDPTNILHLMDVLHPINVLHPSMDVLHPRDIFHSMCVLHSMDVLHAAIPLSLMLPHPYHSHWEMVPIHVMIFPGLSLHLDPEHCFLSQPRLLQQAATSPGLTPSPKIWVSGGQAWQVPTALAWSSFGWLLPGFDLGFGKGEFFG